MNNINKIIILLPVFILGCKSNVIEQSKVLKKINSLDMNIYSMKGEKIYSISSPYSSYDNNKQKFHLEKTTINIFNGEEIKYIISSNESFLSQNNKLVELNGNVKLKTIKQNKGELYADNFIWNIDDNNYLLMGNIKYETEKVILYSGKAKLGSNNIIEFFNPVKYIIKNDNNENKYEINSENAYYNINNESLFFGAKDKRVRSIINF